MSYDSAKDTIEHINNVRKYAKILYIALRDRAIDHDNTKLHEPEKSTFDYYTPKLAESTYGSDYYKYCLRQMKTALDHHYENNRHHPEHFENGVKGMTLVDLCEMVSDWKAATLRHNDGDILKSIEINQERFGYSDELKQVFINTVMEYFD